MSLPSLLETGEVMEEPDCGEIGPEGPKDIPLLVSGEVGTVPEVVTVGFEWGFILTEVGPLSGSYFTKYDHL